MNINRNNYEVYMIDYFDGKLDPVQTAELMYFLSQNPDLENEFNAYENINLPSSKLKFIDKDQLKKNFSDFQTITDNNLEEFCIAEIEGVLDDKSQTRLYQYLDKNPHKNRELELYKKTKLRPDESVVFPGLGQLKKHRLILLRKSRVFYYTGTAAAVLIVFFLTFIFRRTPEADSITGAINGSEDTRKTDDSFIRKTEKETGLMVEILPPVNSFEKALPGNQVKTLNDDSNQAASGSDIEEFIHRIKPIEIKKIDIGYQSHDILLAKVDPVIEYQPVPASQKNKTLAEFIIEKLSGSEIALSTESLNVWTLAQSSLKGINYLTESDVQIERKVSPNGETSQFSIESESFSFTAPLKR